VDEIAGMSIKLLKLIHSKEIRSEILPDMKEVAIIGEELDRRVKRLMDFGLRGIEGFYSGFTSKLRGEALALAARYGLLVTAGSDYHGKNKLVRLGNTKLDPSREMPEGLKRFLQEIREGGPGRPSYTR